MGFLDWGFYQACNFTVHIQVTWNTVFFPHEQYNIDKNYGVYRARKQKHCKKYNLNWIDFLVSLFE